MKKLQKSTLIGMRDQLEVLRKVDLEDIPPAGDIADA